MVGQFLRATTGRPYKYMQTNSLPYSAIIDSPIGKLGIKLQDNQLANIDFLSKQKALISPTTSLTKKIVKQLESYFNNPKFE